MAKTDIYRISSRSRIFYELIVSGEYQNYYSYNYFLQYRVKFLFWYVWTSVANITYHHRDNVPKIEEIKTELYKRKKEKNGFNPFKK